MTLLWHNHFATSNNKVLNLTSMRAQNETLRRYCLSPFGELLNAMSHDSALLEWLDAPSNHVGRPNENIARELMELFTLGVGNYSERDVSESARAFTGWTIKDLQFRINDDHHDHGEKTVLGHTGKMSGDDVIAILLQQPSCARRLAWRLISEFFGENIVSEAAMTELADGLRQKNLDLRWAVETILRSEMFFSDANIQSRIADPVSFLLIPLRAIECWQSALSTFVLAEWLDRLGQSLFYPPNVGGWNGGREWLSTRTVIARANYAHALTNGQLIKPARSLEMPKGLATITDSQERLALLGTLLCGEKNSVEIRRIASESIGVAGDNSLSDCIQEFLTRPEAQLN